MNGGWKQGEKVKIMSPECATREQFLLFHACFNSNGPPLLVAIVLVLVMVYHYM